MPIRGKRPRFRFRTTKAGIKQRLAFVNDKVVEIKTFKNKVTTKKINNPTWRNNKNNTTWRNNPHRKRRREPRQTIRRLIGLVIGLALLRSLFVRTTKTNPHVVISGFKSDKQKEMVRKKLQESNIPTKTLKQIELV